MAINIIKRIWNEGFFNEIKRLRVKSYFLFFKLRKQNITKSGFLRSFYGPLMLENWNDITFRFCLRGSYGVFFSNFLKQTDKEFIFLDIGANQGLYTLIASKNKNCKECFSFEPVPQTIEILKKNISKNDFSGKVKVIESGIDAIQSNKMKIFIDPTHSGSATLNDVSNSSSYSYIKTINRNYLEKLNLPDNGEIIIKIDVEGNEVKVLNELINTTFFNRVSVIYFEYDENHEDAKKLLTFMEKNKFETHHLKDSVSHTQYNIFAKRKINYI